MTTTSPDEALHFRGKTLTPESPRPVHIPEPANIPILQNQMDPIFNDTSTYHISQGSCSYDNNAFHQQQQHQQQQQYPVQNLGEQLQESYVSVTGAVLQNGEDNTLGPLGAGQPVADSVAGSLLKDSDGTGKENESTFSIAHNAPISKQLSSPGLQPQSPRDTANPELPAPPASGQGAPAPVNGRVASEDPSQTLSSLQNPSAALQSTESISYNETNEHAQQSRDDANGARDEGVDYQNLLDNLSPSVSTAPSAPAVTATATSAAEEPLLPSPNSEKIVQAAQGLPPRPPPQDKPSIHPNYAASDNIRSFHQIPAQNPNISSAFASQPSNHPPTTGLPDMMAAAPGAPGAPSAASALPPPPVATFQQTAPTQDTCQGDKMDVDTSKVAFDGECEAPWGPEVQKKYDKFLHDERIYVTEGLWDRFPSQSRLFIGNLPTERVTKRDLFHLFHKYGKLAQISIKQAYGFVQFLESSACRKALQVEQGGTVRGRKIHLEISKPQRNTRNAPPPAPEPARVPPPARRSRSPVEHGRPAQASRVSRSSGDRYDRPYEPTRLPFNDFRDEHPRRRDDYRPPRSPSPRPFRGRDGYRSRDRTPERYDRRDRRRSRSPPPYSRSVRYRTPSPRSRDYDSDSDLPIPRRTARDVPDVQIIVLDDVDRTFVYLIETAFRDRGLRSDVIILSPRLKLSSVIRRQIIEGVMAVVKVSRTHQYTRKISLQVFDRSGGAHNVRFNEYSELGLKVAADVVAHAQNTQRSALSNPYQVQPFVGPQLPPQQPQQPIMPSVPGHNNISNLIATLDGPGLQSLLGALQRTPATVQAIQQRYPPSSGSSVDLASLLSNLSRQPNPPQTIPQTSLPYGPMPNPAFGQDSNLLSMLSKGITQPNTHQQQHHQQQPPPQPNSNAQVQNIMDQLAKWQSK